MLEYTRHFMIFIAISSAVRTTVSTCVYDTPLCDCYEVDVTCVGLQEIPPLNPKSDLDSIMTVELTDGNITSMSKDSLPPGLSHLLLSRHPLTNLSDDIFDNSATTLYHLIIEEAQFRRLPQSMLKLTTLRELIIVDTPIENWEGYTLENLRPTLTDLTLLNVGFAMLPSWISNCHALINLDLTGNLLNSVANNAFHSNNQSLINLFQAYSGLTQDTSWSPPEELTLNLSSYDFDFGIFYFESSPASSSDTEEWDLYITLLKLNTIINFSNTPHLYSLSLDNNNISVYADGSLPPFVYSLSLTGNHLSTVPKAVARTYFLQVLNLSRNVISKIEEGTFNSKITTLDLSFNKLIVITNTAFSNLKNLELLYLNDNPISAISPSAFSKFELLGLLSLDSTNLTEFPVAFTTIVHRPLEVTINATNLTCNCSQAAELKIWYKCGRRITVTGLCTDGRAISEYILTTCDLQTALVGRTTTPTGDATAGCAITPGDYYPDGDATTPRDYAPGGDATTPTDYASDGRDTSPTDYVHTGGLTTRVHSGLANGAETAADNDPDDNATTPTGHAPALKFCVFCRHGTLLLIIAVWIHSD